MNLSFRFCLLLLLLIVYRLLCCDLIVIFCRDVTKGAKDKDANKDAGHPMHGMTLSALDY